MLGFTPLWTLLTCHREVLVSSSVFHDNVIIVISISNDKR